MKGGGYVKTKAGLTVCDLDIVVRGLDALGLGRQTKLKNS